MAIGREEGLEILGKSCHQIKWSCIARSVICGSLLALLILRLSSPSLWSSSDKVAMDGEVSEMWVAVCTADSEEVWPSESAVIWRFLSQAILNKDRRKAREEKKQVEEKQSELFRERQTRVGGTMSMSAVKEDIARVYRTHDFQARELFLPFRSFSMKKKSPSLMQSNFSNMVPPVMWSEFPINGNK